MCPARSPLGSGGAPSGDGQTVIQTTRRVDFANSTTKQGALPPWKWKKQEENWRPPARTSRRRSTIRTTSSGRTSRRRWNPDLPSPTTSPLFPSPPRVPPRRRSPRRRPGEASTVATRPESSSRLQLNPLRKFPFLFHIPAYSIRTSRPCSLTCGELTKSTKMFGWEMVARKRCRLRFALPMELNICWMADFLCSSVPLTKNLKSNSVLVTFTLNWIFVRLQDPVFCAAPRFCSIAMSP